MSQNTATILPAATFSVCDEQRALNPQQVTKPFGGENVLLDCSETPAIVSLAAYPSDEDAFVPEEVIVDQYAAMDEARRMALRTPDSDVETPHLPFQSSNRIQQKSPTTRVDGPTKFVPVKESDTTDTVPMSTDCPKLFVGASDAPASYEVGASLDDDTDPLDTELKEPELDLLVIEEPNHTQTGRVDEPQSVGVRGPGAYRRLFSYARKS
jgi:hypothetical protein